MRRGDGAMSDPMRATRYTMAELRRDARAAIADRKGARVVCWMVELVKVDGQAGDIARLMVEGRERTGETFVVRVAM